MSYLGVVLAGTVGSWVGSAITYWASAWVGRPLVMRYGKYFLMPPDKLEMAERWVQEYGSGGIFFARLLPVIRHLISIPAGVCRMNFMKFSVMTIAGAFIWCAVLTYFGPAIITEEMFHDPESMKLAIKSKIKPIVALIALMAALYAVMKFFASRARKS
jgi:membrane protein DedA with SNARE-associated domain